ncbi:MAG: ABC transporter permease [Gemmatimonas sp.]
MQRVLARFVQGLLVVFVATSIAFLLLRSAKGDEFSSMYESPGARMEDIARLREQRGFNQPLLTQYTVYVGQALRGDFGLSSSNQYRPVSQTIRNALGETITLMFAAFVLSIVAGIALGTWQGAREGSRAATWINRLTLGIISMPDFWVGTALIVLFVLHWHVFPSTGSSTAYAGQSLWSSLLSRLHHLVLPLTALVLVNGAVFARFQSASMREVMPQQFLRTARAKGASEERVIRHHALRLAVLPQITLMGMYFPALLVGTILVERIFSWPGMGSLLTKAISGRDFPLVAGIVVVGSAMTALGSFLADTAREIVDPRLRSS